MLNKIIPLITEYEHLKQVKQLIDELIDCSEGLNQTIFVEIYEFASKIDPLILGRTAELERMVKIEVMANRIPRIDKRSKK